MVVWYYDNWLHVLQQVGSLFNDHRGGLSAYARTKYVDKDASELSSCSMTGGFIHPYDSGNAVDRHVLKRVLLIAVKPMGPGTECSVYYGTKFKVTGKCKGNWAHHLPHPNIEEEDDLQSGDDASTRPQVCHSSVCVCVCLYGCVFSRGMDAWIGGNTFVRVCSFGYVLWCGM